MTNDLSRLGAINGNVATRDEVNALFLKVYAGEVLTAFQRANVTMPYHSVRTIASGKSAQFPVTGKAAAYYHTPGNRIDGGKIQHNERLITIDDLLISPTFIYQMDEAKNHYDVRSIYSGEQGLALATQMDQHVLQMGVKAARVAEGNISGALGTPGGTVIYQDSAGLPAGSDFRSNGDHLAAALFKAAETLDRKDVPAGIGERVVFLRPAEYYLLVQSDKVINRDFNAEGNGSISSGKVFSVAGIDIVMTNNLPESEIIVSPGQGDSQLKYAGDFSNTVGLVMHKSAVGTVKLMDLALESEYQIDYQGTLMVAKYAMGHDYLRPEGAVELRAEDAPVG